MKSKTLIFSRGILHIPHLNSFFPESELHVKSFYTTPKVDCIIGWGLRPSTKKAQVKHQLLYIALEDGFLRSIGLGINGFPPFSLVHDDLGIYYDTTSTSRLEQLILAAHFSDEAL